LVANLNVIVFEFVELDLDVTTIVAVHKTPGVNPLILIVLSGVNVEDELANTTLPSRSFLTVTSILTPDEGRIEVILIIIGNEVPTTLKIPFNPGSTFTENNRATSAGFDVGAFSILSTFFVQEFNTNGIINNINL
jgi:hypothetical protein